MNAFAAPALVLALALPCGAAAVADPPSATASPSAAASPSTATSPSAATSPTDAATPSAAASGGAEPAASLIPVPAATENPRVTALAKSQFRDWQAGKLDHRLYDDTANKAFTPAILSQVADQLGPLGVPTKFTFVRAFTKDAIEAYLYAVTAPKGNVQMIIGLDADRKIAAILFRPAPAP